MLKLVDVVKKYGQGDSVVEALKGVSIEFRKNEFVSVLGQSGCGKTTLLNIIGGLDRYTSGDLIINGRSTKEYKDRDWDTYRNHSIGFVFQSYNLIPHQTVLANVELALTLSGVSKAERKERAVAALTKVGLSDQINKKPNQLSGGQMQRVAIARALINDPEILLADEPTGALDSETSEQIMQLLKEVADDRLVIMVTHNPELAEQYSTRIIRLLDGRVIGDTNPYDEDEAQEAVQTESKTNKGSKRRTSMSFFTALSLSLKNLMTKKGRTFLTSFAGSIGIIGIALILSLSSGFQAYIDKVQEETLSTYPITIMAENTDMSELMQTLMGAEKDRENHEEGKVYVNSDAFVMINTFMNPDIKTNDLVAFKKWLESGESGIEQYASGIQYGYSTKPEIYVSDTSKGILPANDYMALFDDVIAGSEATQMMPSNQMTSSIEIFTEMLGGKNGELIDDLIYSQYELIDDGMRWPQNKNEVVLIVDEHNEIAETYLYSLGFIDRGGISDLMKQIMTGEEAAPESNYVGSSWDYSDFVGTKYKLIVPSDKFLGIDSDGDGKNDRWVDMSKDDAFMKLILGSAEELEIVGIIRPKPDVVATTLNAAVGYTSALTDWYLEKISESDMIKYQMENPGVDILTGLPFETADSIVQDQQKPEKLKEWCQTLNLDQKAEVYMLVATTPDKATLESMLNEAMKPYPDRASKEAMLVSSYAQNSEMDEETVKKYISEMTDKDFEDVFLQAMTVGVKKAFADNAEKQLSGMTKEVKVALLDQTLLSADAARLVEIYDLTHDMRYSASSLSKNLKNFGYSTPDEPNKINIFAATFENKDKIAELIKGYNDTVNEEQKISYTDYVALMMSSISTIINVISYVLIAFVSISLVVSSIMIGIITYISVLERTKEIGILRSIGASKKDISRVFNAETLIVGFVAGAIGIIVTLLLNIPINIIIEAISDIKDVSFLPPVGAAILVAISMVLTFIAGLIPSRFAAKKDPVVALRTE